MKISLGFDHGGVELRSAVLSTLENLGHTVIDHGTHSRDSVDYPDYARLVAQDVIGGAARFGILVCSSGIGMSLSANKFPGIRAALVHYEDDAHYCRAHNDANILCLGERHTTPWEAAKIITVFLATPFEAGRHARRLGKFADAPESPLA